MAPGARDARPCPDCGGIGYRIGARGEFAHAEVCGCQQHCAACGGRRWTLRVEGGYEVTAPCACVGLVERVRLFNEARIPAGYADKTIPGFHHAPGETMLAEAKQRFMRYERGGDVNASRGIVLVGPPGVGKTHLVCAYLNYATLQKGIACRFVDFFELTARIRETFGARGGDPFAESEGSIIEPLVQVPVLAIDDLGKGRGSNWELTIIDQLITRRYNAGRVVLATTNYAPEAQDGLARAGRKPSSAESLEERIGERLYSRLCEMADIVVMSGKDRRRVPFEGTRPVPPRGGR